MSRNIGAVAFEDGTRLFLIFDGTLGSARRPLFNTSDEAWKWYSDDVIEFAEPANAVATEERVTCIEDIAFEHDSLFLFESRATRKAMWLTGPRSRSEMREENMKEDNVEFENGFLARPVEKEIS